MKRLGLIAVNVVLFVLVAAKAQAQGLAYGALASSGMASIYFAIASAFTIGIAAVGGAIAQSRAASSALEGIARNPEAAGKVMAPMIIALALIESLVIYALVIAYLLQAKIV